jgi:hypothetical protein
MKFPTNIYEVLEIAGRVECAITRKPTASVDVKGNLLREATRRFDDIAGRFDVPNTLPSRNLNVTDGADNDRLKALGAVYDVTLNQWVVPEGKDLSPFSDWWPEIAPDLRDATPRMLMTKSGRSVTGYVLPDDVSWGEDSTATSLMYAALPMIAALSFMLGALNGPLGGLALLLAVPYLVSLAQSEGLWDAVKSAFLLMILPLGAASTAGLFAQGMRPSSLTPLAGSLLTNPTAAIYGSLGALAMVAVGALVLTGLGSVFDAKAKTVMGGFWERFKATIKWGIFITIAFVLCVSILPGFMHPFFYFGLACLYPMLYTEGNFLARAEALQANGEKFNLASQGNLTSAHEHARLAQARRAMDDKSPLLEIGTASGWLTALQYSYAPDANARMVVSAKDLTMHMLCFGMTGSGKTTSVARPLALQWVESGYGGMLVLCGKGSLPGELSGITDIMVKPGMSFAPFQGLTGSGVAAAINSLGNKDVKDPVWEQGADMLIEHAADLHFALHNHELVYQKHAGVQARELENAIDWLNLEVIRLQAQGEDSTDAEAKLQATVASHDDWARARDRERIWLWNVDTFVEVVAMINSVRTLNGARVAGKKLIQAADYLGYQADPIRRMKQPQSIHPDLGKGSLLDGTMDYALVVWPGLMDGHQSSFMLNANNRILPLTRGPKLVNEDGVHWKSLEQGEDVGQCLYGKSVGVDLPETVHGRAGLVISALVKQRVYTQVRLRSQVRESEWLAQGQRPMLFLGDEAQILVGKQELELLPIARSLGMSCVFLTQGFESLQSAFGSEVAAQTFANTCQNLVCLKASHQTYAYMSERLGTAQLVTYKQHTVGLDLAGGMTKLAGSPLSDPHHPERAAMRKLARLGYGKLVIDRRMTNIRREMWGGHRTNRMEEERIIREIVVPITGAKEIVPLFKPEEYTALLVAEGQGIVYLNRAGAPRVDLAKLLRVGADDLRA